MRQNSTRSRQNERDFVFSEFGPFSEGGLAESPDLPRRRFSFCCRRYSVNRSRVLSRTIQPFPVLSEISSHSINSRRTVRALPIRPTDMAFGAVRLLSCQQESKTANSTPHHPT